MLEVSQAVQHVEAAAKLLPPTTVPLAESVGRILREVIVAERDQPPFDRVMMDGIAIRHSAHSRDVYRRTATVYAGDAPVANLVDADECIEVMTGAVLPAGADSVVPVEQLSADGDSISIDSAAKIAQGQYIHRRGSDHTLGTTLLKPGQLIGTAEVAVLASAGSASVAVTRELKLAVVATGDELVPPGEAIAAHQVRLSNGPALASAAAGIGGCHATLEHCPDARDTLRDKLSRLLADNDIVVLSGGVSRGKADYVPEILDELGVAKLFHRVAQRPGKPLWFGHTDSCAVFGLPGNPVSTLVTFHRYVVPYIDLSLGRAARPAYRAQLATATQRLSRLTRFAPVHVADNGGLRVATPLGINTSGDFTALAATAGFVEIAPGDGDLDAGLALPFFPWRRGSG